MFQALCGTVVQVPTLGGQPLQLNMKNRIIKPSTVEKIPGKGLPFPKEPRYVFLYIFLHW